MANNSNRVVVLFGWFILSLPVNKEETNRIHPANRLLPFSLRRDGHDPARPPPAKTPRIGQQEARAGRTCMPTPQTRVRKPGQHALRWRRRRWGCRAQWWSYERDAESDPRSRGGGFRFRVSVWFLGGGRGYVGSAPWCMIWFGWDGMGYGRPSRGCGLS